jgi:predicted nucleic acid-binding protein
LPLSSETAAQIVTDLATWRMHAPEADDVLDAITIYQRYGISFWDGVVVQSAARLGCQSIWSEELNPDQVYAGIRVVNPFSSA